MSMRQQWQEPHSGVKFLQSVLQHSLSQLPCGSNAESCVGAEVEDSEDDAESNRPDDEDENLEISD